MDSKVICPNCGAPNENTSSSCQFCGAPLTEVKISQYEESENDNSSSNFFVEKIKGRPRIKFDKRIFKLEYDEIKDEAKLCLSNNITSSTVGCGHFSYDFNDKCLILYGVRSIISGGKKYNFEYVNSWSCPLINKKNLGLLEKFCNLSLKNCRVDGFLEGEEFLFVLVCRAYYNTIFDHSKYTDATDKLFRYVEEKKQKNIADFKKKCRDENRRQLMIAVMFLGGLFLLGLIIKLIQ